MQIDVISDTVCPWCFIGKRRLARAMAMRPPITFDVKWRPYRLDPTIPKGGHDRKAYMRAKFGEDPMKIVEMHKLIAAEGAKDETVLVLGKGDHLVSATTGTGDIRLQPSD